MFEKSAAAALRIRAYGRFFGRGLHKKVNIEPRSFRKLNSMQWLGLSGKNAYYVSHAG